MTSARSHLQPEKHGSVWDRFVSPVDIASVVFFRIAFGAILVWEVGRYFYYDRISTAYVAPPFHFKYFGFEWVHPWPGLGMYLHFVLLGVAAFLVMVGMWYRVAAILLCLGNCYVLLLDRAQYLNHFYLICLISFLLIFVPAHRNLSVDSWRNPSLRSSVVPAWSLWVLRLQIAIPYVYGGIAKLNSDWLQGQPMQIWMSRMENVRQYFPAFGEHWLALAASYAGLLIDLFVVAFLMWRRTRWVAFGVAVAFHLMNATMFGRIGVFPWLMICATTLFFAPDWPRRFFRVPSGPAMAQTEVTSRHDLAVLAVLAFFFIVQLIVPFRHCLYPGNVDWTEEGSRFAWRMMLCDKAGALRITLVDPVTSQARPFDPRQLLTGDQLVRLGREPDMQREFAAFLKKEFHDLGIGQFEVRVFSLCTLNGRKAQLLVDPSIDLGAQPRSLFPSRWIMPLTERLPEKPWMVPQSEWEQHLRVEQP